MHTGKDRPSVLVADDEPVIRDFCTQTLESHYRVKSVASFREALNLLAKESCDLLLTDVMMDDTSGLQLLAEAKNLRPGLKIIVMSGYITSGTEQRLKTLCEDFLRKPFSAVDLQETVHRCFEGEG